MKRASPNTVTPLLPVELGPARLPFARGARAGDWVFANGTLAFDYARGTLAELERPRGPLSGRPRHAVEAERVFANAAEVLAAGGADFRRAVRADQYFTDFRAVSHFHGARQRACGGYVAPSTSILQPGLLLPEAAVHAEFVALAASSHAALEPLFPAALDVPSTSAFAPVVRAGDWVFVAGFLAAHGAGDLGGIAPQAKVPEGHLWKGNRIKLEAAYALEKKIAVALDAAGSSFEHVVKAQVYLRDMADLPAFGEVWRHWFGAAPPATTFVPTATPGFAIEDARLEINAIALRAGGRTRRRPVLPGLHTGIDGQVAAVRAGDLLCLSGVVAADEQGAVDGCTRDPRAPWFGAPIDAQMEHILDRADAICRAAGTSLANAVRIQHFHTDLAEFHDAARCWQRRLPGTPLPLSAVRVPAPLPVPACSVMVDLWVYAP